MRIQSYRDLTVWQQSIDLAVMCHHLLKNFPAEERFALVAQMRHSSVSIPSNIAEGNASGFRRLDASHVGRAQGSLAELETQMVLAERFSYLEPAGDFWSHSRELGKGLVRLRQRLNN